MIYLDWGPTTDWLVELASIVGGTNNGTRPH